MPPSSTLSTNQLALTVLVIWMAIRSVGAADLLFVPVPALGYFRVDVASLLLAIGGQALRLLSRAVPLRWVAAAAVLLLPWVPLPRYHIAAPFHMGEPGPVAVFSNALPLSVCRELVEHAWAARSEWTHISMAGALGGFTFGGSVNFDRRARGQPRTVLDRLLQWRGHETADALANTEANRERRRRVQAALATHFHGPLRRAYAAQLGVSSEHVFFGGETAAGRSLPGSGPSAQVYLASVAFASVVNVHVDLGYEHNVDWGAINGTDCAPRTLTSFLLPISLPRGGGGLLWWTPADPDGPRSVQYSERARDRVEHETSYAVGSLYTFPSGLAHALRPWPWYEWAAAHHRVTVQAFGMQCGENWLIVH